MGINTIDFAKSDYWDAREKMFRRIEQFVPCDNYRKYRKFHKEVIRAKLEECAKKKQIAALNDLFDLFFCHLQGSILDEYSEFYDEYEWMGEVADCLASLGGDELDEILTENGTNAYFRKWTPNLNNPRDIFEIIRHNFTIHEWAEQIASESISMLIDEYIDEIDPIYILNICEELRTQVMVPPGFIKDVGMSMTLQGNILTNQNTPGIKNLLTKGSAQGKLFPDIEPDICHYIRGEVRNPCLLK